MSDVLRELFRHNAWANQKAIRACMELTEAQVAATLGGTFGAPVETLKHILGAESFYRSLFGLPEDYWSAWGPRFGELTIDELLPWAEKLGAAWEELFASEIDAEQVFEQKRADGTVRRFRAGALLVQAIHHGNVHREQVSSIITSLGLTPPDLSAYAYDRERS